MKKPKLKSLKDSTLSELRRHQFNQAFRALGLKPRNLHYWYKSWFLQNTFTAGNDRRLRPVGWQHYATQAALLEFGRDRFRREAKKSYKAANQAAVDVLARRAELQKKDVYQQDRQWDGDVCFAPSARSTYERRRNIKSRQLCFLNSLFWATGRTARDYDQLLARKRSHRLLSSPHWWF